MLLVAAGIICFLPGLVAPWSRLNNEEQEFDLLSGRARFTRYLLYRQLWQDVRDTPLSEAIAMKDPNSVPRWVKVNVFQPGVRQSPHFVHHGAFGQVEELAMMWRLYDFEPEARAKSARQLLRAMREGGPEFVGSDYLRLLREALGPDPLEGQATSADKIPDDLAARTSRGPGNPREDSAGLRNSTVTVSQ